MARKSKAVAQKKDNENLLWILRIIFTLILFVVVYYMLAYRCNPGWNFPLFALVIIIFLFIAVGLKSPLLLDAVLALITLIIIFSMLFLTGTFCPSGPSQRWCAFPAGISCIQYKLNTTGGLTLVIGQGTGHPISVTGVNCTMNSSASWASDNQGSFVYGPAGKINITPGGQAPVAQIGDGGALGSVTCTNADGTPISGVAAGAVFNGMIYVRYTEMDTNITKTIRGTLTTRYEP